jgi:hypothetical protein
MDKPVRQVDGAWRSASGTVSALRSKPGSGELQAQVLRPGQQVARWNSVSKLQVLPVRPEQQAQPEQAPSSVGLEVAVMYGQCCGMRGRIVHVTAQLKGFQVALRPQPSPAGQSGGGSSTAAATATATNSSSTVSSSSSSSSSTQATVSFKQDQLHVIGGDAAVLASMVPAAAHGAAPAPIFAKHEAVVKVVNVPEWLEDTRLRSNIDLKLKEPARSTLEAWLAGAASSSAPGKQRAVFVCHRHGLGKKAGCCGAVPGEVGGNGGWCCGGGGGNGVVVAVILWCLASLCPATAQQHEGFLCVSCDCCCPQAGTSCMWAVHVLRAAPAGGL